MVYDFGGTPAGVAAVGTRHAVAAIPGAVLKIDLTTTRIDTIPAVKLVITELAMTPDGTDIIASAVDTTGFQRGDPAKTTDFFG